MADTMEAIFANTLTTKGADGAVTRWRFNRDGTYAMTAPDGSSGTGTFKVDAGGFHFKPDGGEGATVAAPPAGKSVGDSWETAGPDGAAVTVTIVAGR
ncbi:MAG: hypothetical protein GC206_01505 [Alphaproteobacteria bacterium]|nr:hypothetical protein [Alphaproteobacteria bacterium]